MTNKRIIYTEPEMEICLLTVISDMLTTSTGFDPNNPYETEDDVFDGTQL